MHQSHILSAVVGIGLCVGGAVHAQDDPAARAQAVLAEVTQALGGDKAASLKSLSAQGEFRRSMGTREVSGGIELYAVLPDMFQQVTDIPRPDGMTGLRIATTINGAEAFRDQTGGGGMFMRFGGPGGPGGPGGQGGQGGWQGGGRGGERMDPAVQIRAEMYRVLLGILPGNPALSDLSYAWIARAESSTGAADVLEVTGPDNFKARLFIDEERRVPLMLSFMQRGQRQMTPPPAGLATQEARREWFEQQRARLESEGPPPMVEVQVFYADYQKVSGVLFPHLITRQINGEVQEQVTIEKYKVNPSIKASQFEKKTKTSE
jgi:hypothetical protein